jgi:hypothetical protein
MTNTTETLAKGMTVEATIHRGGQYRNNIYVGGRDETVRGVVASVGAKFGSFQSAQIKWADGSENTVSAAIAENVFPVRDITVVGDAE